MPDLETALAHSDFGFLRIIANLWGIDLNAPDAKSALPLLIRQMNDASKVQVTVENLPEEARQALSLLRNHKGRLSWSQFFHRFGNVREMGPAKRDREQPYLNPVSPAEVLWYRALIARAFFDTPNGPEEFAYIPNELLGHIRQIALPATIDPAAIVYGRPATAREHNNPLPADDSILDHSCTLLASLRSKREIPPIPIPQTFLMAVMQTANILLKDQLPEPGATRKFLTRPRGEALAFLAGSWLKSKTIDDLTMVPQFSIEGNHNNNPLNTRTFVLSLLKEIPADTWWSVSGFIASIQQFNPDFQRTAGEYDAWLVRLEESGEFIRGYEYWDKVEGALLRYLLSGPLHWLGFLDIAYPEETSVTDPGYFRNISAFRLSPLAKALLAGLPPKGLAEEKQPVHVSSDGLIGIPRLAPRSVRYQIARFCRWEEFKADEYRYRFTPKTLADAQNQGLHTDQLLRLLHRSARVIPPNVIKAIKHWEKQGTAARVQVKTVLRLTSPQLLEKLRASRAARFLEEPLGSDAIVVKTGAEKKVLEILFGMGYLGEIENIENSPEDE